jgi:transposase
VFASAKHLASWAGVCPGNRQSGGRRRSGKTTHGNVWLRGVLGEVAWAAIRTRGTSFGARFRRLARRQGVQKAVVAVMHHLLAVIYAMLSDRVPYQELGPDYFTRQDPQRAVHRHVAQLEHLGYRVSLTPTAA